MQCVRVISHRSIRQFIDRHPVSAEAMERWYHTVVAARWESFVDVRSIFRSCDPVVVASENTVYVFNVGGNKYRIICAIHFNRKKVYILRVLTHSQYDRDEWKAEL
jgi:mRNA interferase HigB